MGSQGRHGAFVVTAGRLTRQHQLTAASYHWQVHAKWKSRYSGIAGNVE